MMLVMSNQPMFDTFKRLGIEKQATVMKVEAYCRLTPCKLTPGGASGTGTRDLHAAMTSNFRDIECGRQANFYLVEDDAALLLKLSGIAPDNSHVWMARIDNVPALMNLCLAFHFATPSYFYDPDCPAQYEDDVPTYGLRLCNDSIDTAKAVFGLCKTANDKFGALFEQIPRHLLIQPKPLCCLQMLLQEFLGDVWMFSGAED
jgi:hypothetical protein